MTIAGRGRSVDRRPPPDGTVDRGNAGVGSERPEDVERLVAGVAPARVAVAALAIGGDGVIECREEEFAAVAKAGRKRRREFAAGRGAAHLAMARLGVDDGPVMASSNGAPIWPAGIVGSISHTDDMAVAIVSAACHRGMLGIDLESIASVGLLSSGVIELILTAEERRDVAALPHADRGVRALVLLSAKESAIKCLSPIVGGLIDLQELRVCVPGSSRVEVRHRLDDLPRLRGRFAVSSRYIAVVVTAA